MIGNQKHKVGTDPKFTGPDEIPLLPKFLSDQNPDQASHYHLLLKEWWESVYENLNRIRDMVVNFQVADLKEGTEGDLISAKNELSQLANDLVRSLDGEVNEAIQNLEGTLTKNITDHINSTNNPHSVTADQLNISTVGKTGDYGDLGSIPSTFSPSAHSHAISDITELTSTLGNKSDTGHSHAYSTLTDIPDLFAPSAHSHAISDITDLSTTLDGKATLVSLGNIVPGNATTTADGLMSSGDKSKLDGMSGGSGISIPVSLLGDRKTWSGNTAFANHSGTVIWLNAPLGSALGGANGAVSVPLVTTAGYFDSMKNQVSMTHYHGIRYLISGNSLISSLTVWRNQYGISIMGQVLGLNFNMPVNGDDTEAHFIAF